MWNARVEVYAQRDNLENKEVIDIAFLIIDPLHNKPLEFAEQLKAFAKKIEKAEKAKPGSIFIQTNI